MVFSTLITPACGGRRCERRQKYSSPQTPRSGTFIDSGAWEAMASSITLIPGMLKPLRIARGYGFLVERRDGLYHPGGSLPACSTELGRKMVEGGWLVKHGERYEPTEQGLRAAE
jgi:hypothetical protein